VSLAIVAATLALFALVALLLFMARRARRKSDVDDDDGDGGGRRWRRKRGGGGGGGREGWTGDGSERRPTDAQIVVGRDDACGTGPTSDDVPSPHTPRRGPRGGGDSIVVPRRESSATSSLPLCDESVEWSSSSGGGENGTRGDAGIGYRYGSDRDDDDDDGYDFEDGNVGDAASSGVCIESEAYLVVYAPRGKLGLIIDSPDRGPAMVHKCKEWSPIYDEIWCGDRIVAVDDVDVRGMPALRVSKIIGGASHRTRKIAVIRYLR
jgi:hypothetical protein